MSYSWTLLQNYFFSFEHVLFARIDRVSEGFHISVNEFTEDIQMESKLFSFASRCVCQRIQSQSGNAVIIFHVQNVRIS